MRKEYIIELLGEDWDGMTSILKESLLSDVGLLNKTNKEVLSHSGKLLRPMICLLMAKALGQPNSDSRRYAAACELLHNATLMHDDVADESPERRGRPTVSALLGPSGAVLVGDFWLAKAVELVFGTKNYDSVAKYFSQTLIRLAEGELYQMERAGLSDTTEDDYLKIITCKTASLFEAAGASGAISVGASEEFLSASAEYSLKLGIAFQIKDDILDYTGGEELGKPLGVDIKEQKMTLPLLGAMLRSGKGEEVRHKVSEIRTHPEYCNEIKTFVLENGGIEYASARLEEYIRSAVNAISCFPSSEAKTCLESIAGYNTVRRL